MQPIIGLDPGRNSGGIAVLWEGVPLIPRLLKLGAATDEDVVDFLEEWTSGVAYLEDPTGAALAKDGPKNVKGIAGPAESFGFLRGVLSALRIPVQIVRPQAWQKPFKLPTLKDCGGNSSLKKRGHREAAQRMFPGTKITNWSADAVLIAQYGRLNTEAAVRDDNGYNLDGN